MRASFFRFLAFSLACATPLWAAAQQPPAQQPQQTPPKLEPLEEGEEPAITIRKEDGERQVTETRKNGKVTEVKVKSGKSTYYLKPNDQAGTAQPGDAQGSLTRPPQWKIKEFDLGPQNNAQETPVNPPVDALPPKPAADAPAK